MIVLGVTDLVWAPHNPGLLAAAAAWLAVGTGTSNLESYPPHR
jgi:hypothetical protein